MGWDIDFPQCGRSAAQFYLNVAGDSKEVTNHKAQTPIAPALTNLLAQAMANLHSLHVSGALTEAEFTLAKSRLLHGSAAC